MPLFSRSRALGGCGRCSMLTPLLHVDAEKSPGGGSEPLAKACWFLNKSSFLFSTVKKKGFTLPFSVRDAWPFPQFSGSVRTSEDGRLPQKT